MLLLHGLGGTKPRSSTPPPRSATHYRVHAHRPARASARPRSPPRAATTRRWFARTVLRRHGRARHRARAPGRQLDGRPGGASRSACARPSASRGLGLLCPAVAFDQARLCTRSCACCAPSSGCCPTASAAAPSSASSGRCSPTATRRPGRGRHRRRRVPAHLRLGRRARSPSWPRPATIYLDRPVRPRRLLPAPGRARSRPALFIWASHDRLIPPALPPPRRALAAGRRAGRARRAAATCRRSSARSRPTACSRRFFAGVDATAARRRLRPRRGGLAA